jgi:hypothetical protein
VLGRIHLTSLPPPSRSSKRRPAAALDDRIAEARYQARRCSARRANQPPASRPAHCAFRTGPVTSNSPTRVRPSTRPSHQGMTTPRRLKRPRERGRWSARIAAAWLGTLPWGDVAAATDCQWPSSSPQLRPRISPLAVSSPHWWPRISPPTVFCKKLERGQGPPEGWITAAFPNLDGNNGTCWQRHQPKLADDARRADQSIDGYVHRYVQRPVSGLK